MNEHFIVRLSRSEYQPTFWIVWDDAQQTVIATGELSHANACAEIAHYAQQRPAIALLDSSDILLREVTLPQGVRRQATQALPYLLEDDLAQDVDSMHFCILRRKGCQAAVAAIDTEYLQQVLSRWQEVGVEFKQILPDCLALPLTQDGLSAAQLGVQWLFRRGEEQGTTIDEIMLADFLATEWFQATSSIKPQAADETQASPESVGSLEEPTPQSIVGEQVIGKEEGLFQIHSYSSLPSNHVQLPGQWQAQTPELMMAILARGALQSRVNLRTGPFAYKSDLLSALRVWIPTGIAAIACLFCFLVLHIGEIYANERQARSYHQATEQIFHTIFPNKKKIPTVSYLKRQIADEQAALGGLGDTVQQGVLAWLQQLEPILKKFPDLQIEDFEFERQKQRVNFQIKGKQFNGFDQLTQALSGQYQVQQGQLSKNDDHVFGRYTLEKK